MSDVSKVTYDSIVTVIMLRKFAQTVWLQHPTPEREGKRLYTLLSAYIFYEDNRIERDLYLGDFARFSEEKALKIPNLGKGVLNLWIAFVTSQGLVMGELEAENWVPPCKRM